jgi:CDP-glucose 4,6-dehydratase
LSPLAGYLRLAERLCEQPTAARAWNFGPRAGDVQPVSWVVSRLSDLFEASSNGSWTRA